MAKLGKISIHVETESENHKIEATMYAVEKGEPFTDHVKKTPSDFSLSGYLLTTDWEGDKDRLIKMMESGEVVKYVGKMIAQNVIITDIGGDHGQEVKNGMKLKIGLRRIRITQTAWVKAPVKQKPVRKPVTETGKKKPVQKNPKYTNKPKAVYHIMKKGQTYWWLSGKYGTSIQQLRNWNKYPDRAIPIGAKLRVK